MHTLRAVKMPALVWLLRYKEVITDKHTYPQREAM